jgi:hypothetical protein
MPYNDDDIGWRWEEKKAGERGFRIARRVTGAPDKGWPELLRRWRKHIKN